LKRKKKKWNNGKDISKKGDQDKISGTEVSHKKKRQRHRRPNLEKSRNVQQGEN